MALSPTGIPLDWDCSSALEALLAESQDGETVPADLQCGEGDNPSPAYSPFSDSSADSGFITPLASEDQLLTGLFGPDCPLICDPGTSPAPSTYSQPSSSNCAVLPPLKQHPPCSMLQNSTFELDEVSSPPQVYALAAKKNAVDPLDRSRKNAEAARQNRLKKKKYMEDLEKDRSRLKAENVIMKTRCTELQTKNRKLETEVEYLRSVLVNQSTLASLIKNIPGTPGINLSTSFSRKRSSVTADISTPSSTLSSKKLRHDSENSNVSGGICLHVSKDNVSLEFCAQCSLKSAQS